MKTAKPKSSIIYQGPSLIDGSPIVVIAIIGSKNTKTGGMIQTHIIRSDVSPLESSKTGADYSICGDCMHRGKPTSNPLKKTAEGRTCYVNLGQGPTMVYKRFKRGGYPIATPDQITVIGAGKTIRLGTYGDPSAVDSTVWNLLLKESIGHTGYTHQHKTNDESAYALSMYSADSVQDARSAHSKGYRTFRVIPVNQWQQHGKTALMNNEVLCPASKEAGYKSTCNDCKLCAGSSVNAKSIAIVAHGAARNSVKG